MVGIGEERRELCAVFRDLHEAGVTILTVGQYLRPTRKNIPETRRLEPHEFTEIAEDALAAGIPRVWLRAPL
jgi:lipoic acid synthetase